LILPNHTTKGKSDFNGREALGNGMHTPCKRINHDPQERRKKANYAKAR